MDIVISATEAVLLDILTEDQLKAYIEANPSKAEAITKALEANAEAKQLEADTEAFMELLESVELPPPPKGILNIYRPFQKVMRHLTEDEIAEVKAKNPNIDQATLEARMVDTDEWKWGAWQTNKASTITKGEGGTSTTKRTRKLAITVSRREGNTLVPIGNFRTSAEAVQYLGEDAKGNSARRHLRDIMGLWVEDYNGEDYLVPEK